MAGASSEAVTGGRRGGHVVVTGAGGFIGRALVAHFNASGREHRALVRREAERSDPSDAVADLVAASDAVLDEALAGAAAIVHLAGRTTAPEQRSTEIAADDFARGNATATARLARAALRAGALRFVLASTVKVNGEATQPGRPFRPTDAPAPSDAYARSKLDAERELSAIAAGTSMATIVLRLPLVYGPGVKGNFATLIEEIARGVNLPLGAIHNRRSILYVGNLIDAIDAVLDAEPPPAGVHFVADAKSVSVPDLARAIARALQAPVELRSVPVSLLELGGRLTGRGELVRRLVDSLEVDGTSFTRATGWLPAHTMDEGLEATARWWKLRHSI